MWRQGNEPEKVVGSESAPGHRTARGSRSRASLAVAVVVALVASTAAWLLPASPAGAADDPLPDPPMFLTVPQATLRLPGTVTATANVRGTTALTGKLILRLRAPGSSCTTGTIVDSAEAVIAIDDSEARATVTLTREYRRGDAGVWFYEAYYPGNDVYASKSVCAPLLTMGEDDLDPGLPAGTIVNDIFADMLGRKPTSGELSSWSMAISSGASTPGDLVEYLRDSEDHQTNVDPVVRLYRAYFLRIPDAGGLRYWIKERRAGLPLGAISQFFSQSAEFENRYGALDNAGFVDLVYQNILGRGGDQAGRTFWIDQLTRGIRDRGNVMIGFSESGEYTRAQESEVHVTVLFVMLLFRSPTQAEFDGMVDLLDVGPDAHIPFTVADLADDLLAL